MKLSVLGGALACVSLMYAFRNNAAFTETQKHESFDWPSYAGEITSTKFAELGEINARNVGSMRVVWRWASPDADLLKLHPNLRTWKFEATPLVINGILYTSTSLNRVAALDAASGRTLWVYDPEVYKDGTPVNFGFTHRGVTFWKSGESERIVYGTGNGYLICLDAKTGKTVRSFGHNGRVDLTEGLGRPVSREFYGVNSPVVILRDTIVVGSTVVDFPATKPMPPGDVRGFDVRTGKLRWTFHTIPDGGEVGSETWPRDASQEFGAANVWAPMAADESLGYVYLPVSSPSGDYYGGGRPGNNLFAESLVCLDVRTGKRVWHFQMVHHGLWDRDPPAAPILTDIRVGQKLIRAVTQVTKQGFVFVFDRVSGEPVWPIVERPVPASSVPGEQKR